MKTDLRKGTEPVKTLNMVMGASSRRKHELLGFCHGYIFSSFSKQEQQMPIRQIDKTDITKVDCLDQVAFVRQSLYVPIFLKCKVVFQGYKEKVYCLIAETWNIFLAIKSNMDLYKAKFYVFKKRCCHIFCNKTWLCSLAVEHHQYFQSNSSAASWHEILTLEVLSLQSNREVDLQSS